MKTILLLSLFTLPLVSFSQTFADIAPGITKEKQRAVITNKMDELINRVYLETDCPKDQITYVVVDKHVGNKKEEELPKTVVIKACGKKLVFINVVSNSNFIVYGDSWANGTWTLNSVSEFEKK